AVQYLIEIKDSCITASQFATKEGPAAEKPLRGCHCNVFDAALHADAIHYSGGQIILTCRRVASTSVLTTTSGLQEPVFLADIQCPESAMGDIYGALNCCRSHIFSEERCPSTPLEPGKVRDVAPNTHKHKVTFEAGDTVLARITPIPPKGAPRFAGPYKIERITKGSTQVLRAEGGELLLRPYAALQLLALDQDPAHNCDLHEGDFIHTPTTIEAGVSYHQNHGRGYPANKETRETKEAPQDLPTLTTPDTSMITHTRKHISMHMPHAQSL
ncbi:translation elongation factor 2, partial [Spiromyces aspiralis]